jgi:hypothetical protein
MFPLPLPLPLRPLRSLMVPTLGAVHLKGVGVVHVRRVRKEGHAVLDHGRRGRLCGVGLSGDCPQEESQADESEEEEAESEEDGQDDGQWLVEQLDRSDAESAQHHRLENMQHDALGQRRGGGEPLEDDSGGENQSDGEALEARAEG